MSVAQKRASLPAVPTLILQEPVSVEVLASRRRNSHEECPLGKLFLPSLTTPASPVHAGSPGYANACNGIPDADSHVENRRGAISHSIFFSFLSFHPLGQLLHS
jgi:hypothetical protein